LRPPQDHVVPCARRRRVAHLTKVRRPADSPSQSGLRRLAQHSGDPLTRFLCRITDSPSDSAQLLARATEAQAASATSPAAPPATPTPAATSDGERSPRSVRTTTAACPAGFGPCPGCPAAPQRSCCQRADRSGLRSDSPHVCRDGPVRGRGRRAPRHGLFRADAGPAAGLSTQRLAGRDLIVQSRTGSGKTAAFGIPFVQRCSIPTPMSKTATRRCWRSVRRESWRCKCPTRSAASPPAAAGDRRHLRWRADGSAGRPLRPARTWCRGRQAGCSITSVAARCNLSRVKALVLDEADEMLSMGFLEDITEILKRCPPERQTLLFSATMPDEVVRLASIATSVAAQRSSCPARASQPPRSSTPTTWSPAWAGCATCSASSRSSVPTRARSSSATPAKRLRRRRVPAQPGPRRRAHLSRPDPGRPRAGDEADEGRRTSSSSAPPMSPRAASTSPTCRSSSTTPSPSPPRSTSTAPVAPVAPASAASRSRSSARASLGTSTT
jgi:hypothetical protein